MRRDVFVIEPDTESLAGHERFSVLIPFLILGDIKVVDIPTGAECPVDPLSLFRSWVDLRFKTLEQLYHLLSSEHKS